VNELRASAAEYLAVRRALGYRLERTERLLGQFIDHVEAQDAEQITVEHALAWATLPSAGEHWHAMRLGAVRGLLPSSPGRCGDVHLGAGAHVTTIGKGRKQRITP
jgi:hypothetical protein